MRFEQKFSRRVSDKPDTDSAEEPLLPMDLVTEVQEELPLPLPRLEDEQIENYIHEHNTEAMFLGAREHIIEILQTVKDDERAVELINETLQSIFRYVESIYKMEVQTKLLSLRWEGQELRDKIQNHDERRRRAHDALIANLVSCTRYLNEHFFSKNPGTGIYNRDRQHLIDQNRIAIGDWAIEVEHEILLARPR